MYAVDRVCCVPLLRSVSLRSRGFLMERLIDFSRVGQDNVSSKKTRRPGNHICRCPHHQPLRFHTRGSPNGAFPKPLVSKQRSTEVVSFETIIQREDTLHATTGSPSSKLNSHNRHQNSEVHNRRLFCRLPFAKGIKRSSRFERVNVCASHEPPATGHSTSHLRPVQYCR